MSSASNSPTNTPPAAAAASAAPLSAVPPAVAKPVLAAVKPALAAAALPPGAAIKGVAIDPKLATLPGPRLGAAPAVQPIRPQIVPPGAPPGTAATIRPAVRLARIKPRHRMLALSFLLIVVLPILTSALYLWGKAEDQYASTVGFSVRSEQVGSAMDLLGGFVGISKSSSSDTDILYEFLRSQKLVADMDAKLNLRAIWSKPQGDPVFAFNPSGSIEDLVDYWGKMVRTSYDSSTRLIEVRVLAFTPEDATRIAQELFDQSSKMINDLSSIAREDSIKYSREELATTQERLRAAREAITAFRVKNKIVDPTSDFQTQAGLVASLETQLAAAQIEIDLMGDVGANDPRLVQAKRRVEVIQARIEKERNKVGAEPTDPASGDAAAAGPDASRSDYATLAADYERLAVDREFAERAYVAALASYDAAQAEVQRKSRYLAAHILPTRAEVSRYPERLSLLGVMALFLMLAWAIAALMAYSLRDRR